MSYPDAEGREVLRQNTEDARRVTLTRKQYDDLVHAAQAALRELTELERPGTRHPMLEDALRQIGALPDDRP